VLYQKAQNVKKKKLVETGQKDTGARMKGLSVTKLGTT
jgi:hypothetical protein